MQLGKKRREEKRSSVRELLMLLPNLLKLLYRLIRDSRVPTAEKALLVGTVTYVITPLDLLPDVIPFVGQVDDLYLVSLVLLRLLSRTESDVLNEHWDGPGDLAHLVDRIATVARYVLPKRVSKVLLGRVVVAPKVGGGLFVSPGVPASPEEPAAAEKIRQPHAS
ncbi:MAG: YkvA family protein [Acidobacteriota bacterium]